jgi:hypothetical protein
MAVAARRAAPAEPDRVDATVWPQIGAAYAGGRYLDDCVRSFENSGGFMLLETHVERNRRVQVLSWYTCSSAVAVATSELAGAVETMRQYPLTLCDSRTRFSRLPRRT